MARPAFKRWWTQIIPPAAERSTFVLFASALLALIVWQWRPLPGVVWEVREPDRRRGAARPLLPRLGDRPLRDLPDRPLRAVRPAPDGRPRARPADRAGAVHRALPLSRRPAPADARLPHRVLGRAGDVPRTPPLRRGDHGVGARRDPHRGGDPRRDARRAVRRLSAPRPRTPAAIPLVEPDRKGRECRDDATQ